MPTDHIATRNIRHGFDDKGGKAQHKRFVKGSRIPAGTLSERDEKHLRSIGAITPVEAAAETVKIVPVHETPGLSAAELEALSVPQLNAYAIGRGLTVKGRTKNELVSEISQALQAGAALQQAQAEAQTEGRA